MHSVIINDGTHDIINSRFNENFFSISLIERKIL